jgi:Leucine-rich repeat (LRR) protein
MHALKNIQKKSVSPEKPLGEKGMRFFTGLLFIVGAAFTISVMTGCSGKNSGGPIPPEDSTYTGPFFNDVSIDGYSLKYDGGAYLRGYPKLQFLHGVFSGTFDFKNLRACSLLVHLYLQADTFVNLSSISKLTHLTYLNIWGYSAGPALSGFSGLINLDTLSIQGFSATTDFSALCDLPNLEIINVTGSPLTAMPPFTAAKGQHLRQVAMTNCKALRDISGLAQCANLDSIFFWNCGVVDSLIPPLLSVKYCTMVNCSSLTSINHVAQMTNLEYLTINGPISDWSPLAKLVNLVYLDIGGIADLTPLDSLTKLKTLILGDWQLGGCPAVSDITCIANLSNISYLSIKNTAVTNFTPLLTIMNAGDTVCVTWGDRVVVDSLLKAANIDAVTSASLPWGQ